MFIYLHANSTSGCEKIKLFISTIVVNALVAMVFVGVAKGYCVLRILPIFNFLLLFAALTLLAYCEALHYAVVSLQKWYLVVYSFGSNAILYILVAMFVCCFAVFHIF